MEGQRAGVTIGLVKDLDDPKKLGRVQVEYPLCQNRTSAWARVATLMASKERGVFFRPDKGDEVLVIFEDGDPRRPYVLGALWSKAAPPPKEALPPANDLRLIVSRSGHTLRFQDKKGSELVELVDRTGDRRVVLDSSKKKLRVYAKSGDVEVRADRGNVKVSATKGRIDVEGATVNVKSKGNMRLEAKGKMTIKGSMVDIN